MASKQEFLILSVVLTWLSSAPHAMARQVDHSRFLLGNVSSGSCVSYTQPASNALCADMLNNKFIYLPEGQSISAIETELQAYLGEFTVQEAASNCYEAIRQLACRQFLPACHQFNITSSISEVVSVPESVCTSVCESVHSICSSDGANATKWLPACDTIEDFDTHWPHLSLEIPTSIREVVQPSYVFPEDQSLFNISDEIVAVDCLNMPTLECEAGFSRFYGGSCQVQCPHPLYSNADYEHMQYLYGVPGVLGFIFCCALLIDNIMAIVHKSPQHASFRKSRVFYLQAVAAFAGCFFGFVGPINSYRHSTNSPTGCKEPVILEVLEPSDMGPAASLACKSQQSSIYAILLILAVIFLHLNDTHSRLLRTSRGFHGGGSSRLGLMKSARKQKLFAAVFGVAILCACMYIAEGFYPSDASHYQGMLLRYSYICGPRLDIGPDILLLKGPLILLSLMIMFKTWHARSLLHELLIFTQTELSATPLAPLRNHVLNLSRNMSLLGALCTIFTFIYIIIDILLDFDIDESAEMFADWARCTLVGSSAKLGGSWTCEEVLATIGGPKFKYATFPKTPHPELFILRYAAQSIMVFAFALVYVKTAYNRRFVDYNSMSLSSKNSSLKKRRRTQPVQELEIS